MVSSEHDRSPHADAPSASEQPTAEDVGEVAAACNSYEFEYTEQSNGCTREEVCLRKAEHDISAMIGRRPRDPMPDPTTPDAPDVFRGQRKRASGVYANRGGKKHQKQKNRRCLRKPRRYTGAAIIAIIMAIITETGTVLAEECDRSFTSELHTCAVRCTCVVVMSRCYVISLFELAQICGCSCKKLYSR